VLRLIGFLGEPVMIAAIEELAKGFEVDSAIDGLNDMSFDPGGVEFLRRLTLQLDIDTEPPKLADFMPRVPTEFVSKPIPKRPAKATTTSGKLATVTIRTPHECVDTTRDQEEL
jgi:hypothetical protein